MKLNEYSMKVTGQTGPLKARKCLRWETITTVPDEDVAFYEMVKATHPEMLDEDYTPYDEVCAEYGDAWEELRIPEPPEWVTTLTDYPIG